MDLHRYSLALVQAANRGMEDNPKIGGAYNPIHHGHGASLGAAEELLVAGIPVDFAQAIVYAAACAFEPARRGEQIKSLGYFRETALLIWERKQGGHDRPPKGARRSGGQRRNVALETAVSAERVAREEDEEGGE